VAGVAASVPALLPWSRRWSGGLVRSRAEQGGFGSLKSPDDVGGRQENLRRRRDLSVVERRRGPMKRLSGAVVHRCTWGNQGVRGASLSQERLQTSTTTQVFIGSRRVMRQLLGHKNLSRFFCAGHERRPAACSGDRRVPAVAAHAFRCLALAGGGAVSPWRIVAVADWQHGDDQCQLGAWTRPGRTLRGRSSQILFRQ